MTTIMITFEKYHKKYNNYYAKAFQPLHHALKKKKGTYSTKNMWKPNYI